jgi:hypothetical protein
MVPFDHYEMLWKSRLMSLPVALKQKQYVDDSDLNVEKKKEKII